MTETIPSSTVLDRPIAAWLAHQRALGRGFSVEERVLDSLRRCLRPAAGRRPRSGRFRLLVRDPSASRRQYPAGPPDDRPPVLPVPTTDRSDLLRPRSAVLLPAASLSGSRHRHTRAGGPHAGRGGQPGAHTGLAAPARGDADRPRASLYGGAEARRGAAPDPGRHRSASRRAPIRASKFHKSRLVPLSPDARKELRAYLRGAWRPRWTRARRDRCCATPPAGFADTPEPA